MGSQQPAKFGGHRHCDSENVCHVILQDHVIKESYDFWAGAHQEKSPSYEVCGL